MQKFAALGAWVALAVFLLALADYFVRLPLPVRIGHWCLGVGAFSWAWWRFVRPALRFRPSLTDVALRVEASEEGVKRGLSGWLASALELSTARNAESTEIERSLSQRVVAEAAQRFRGLDPGVLLRTSASAQRGMVLLIVALLPVLGAAVTQPGLSRIGILRTLWPFAAPNWPKRSAVVDVTQITAHPTTAALPMRAALLRGPGGLGADEDVTLRYRVLVENRPPREGGLLLTPQARTIDLGDAGVGGSIKGELYETLVEPGTLLGAGEDVQRGELEYWFTTRDDATTPAKILLLQPPRIMNAVAHVTLPDYATATPGSLAHGDQSLGLRSGDGDAIGPVLAGSRITLDLTLSRDVPTPEPTNPASGGVAINLPGTPVQLGAAETRDFVLSTFAGSVPAGTTATFDGTRWTLAWTANESSRLVISPIDEHKIRAADDVVLRFNTVADRPPNVAIIDPTRDEDVLASAVIDVKVEAKDDVALAWAALQRQIRRVPADSAGAPAEVAGPEESVSRLEVTSAVAKPEAAAVSVTMELAPLGVKAGDEVWLYGVAADRLTSNPDGTPRTPVKSTPRKLRIISEAKFNEQVRAELQTLRQAAIRLESEQATLEKQAQSLRQSTEQPSADLAKTAQQAAELAQAQRGIGDRAQPQRDLVRQLKDRVERNAMSDAELRQTLDQADEAIKSAAEASQQASDELQATQSAADAKNAQAAKESVDKAQQDQREVRDELSRLIDRLDRGQDGWATRQNVQRLLDEQQRLSQQTRDAGQRNAGQDQSKLDAQQKRELEQIASRQEDLARKTADALEAMRERGEQLAKTDPGQAGAMARAQEQARQQQLQDTMRRAGEQTRRNQTGEANQLQQQAEKTLQEMLKQLDDADKRRDEALQRVLVQLVDSIGKLIATQRTQLDALAATERGEQAADTLAPTMATLAQNTSALADSIGEASMKVVQDLLLSAAEAQAAAVVALRSTPADTFEADTSERQSLQRLIDAQTEARKKAEQADERENDRKREELAKAYNDALSAQKALEADAAALIGKEISRRDRATLRAIGEKQEALRQSMIALRDKTDEMKEAKLFSYAHQRYDKVASGAVKALGESRADAALQRDLASAVSVLRSLATALDDAKKNKDFRDAPGGQQSGQGQGQGGSQPQPLLPPVTELRLLRMMQEDAIARTRDAGTSGSADALQDATTLQRDLTGQGALLLEKLKAQQGGDGPEGGKPKTRDAVPNAPSMLRASLDASRERTSLTSIVLAYQPAEPAPTPAPAPSNADRADPIPSLDDLLGVTPEIIKPAGATNTEPPKVDDALDRALSPNETKELFEETVDLMGRAATRLEKQQDAGPQTQRQQEDVLRKLDKLIDEAQKQQQKQQQSSSSSSSDPKPNESQQERAKQEQQQQRRTARSNNSDQNAGPPQREDGARGNAATGTASWGGLPAHVRDALMQGFSDSFSSMYKQMTEDYYKKLAEEKK